MPMSGERAAKFVPQTRPSEGDARSLGTASRTKTRALWRGVAILFDAVDLVKKPNYKLLSLFPRD